MCLSGLIWQITQISVRFFAFDVTKNTNVILPEEINASEKVFYVCFESSEYMIQGKYDELVSKKFSEEKISSEYYNSRNFADPKREIVNNFTVSERYSMSPDSNETFQSLNRTDFTDFIIGTKYCIQFEDTRKKILIKRIIPNITQIGLEKSPPLPQFDYDRIHTTINLGDENEAVHLRISSISFTIKKLQFPYTDKCANYNKSELLSTRRLVIENCINELTISSQRMLSKYHVCKIDDKHNNYTISPRYLNTSKDCYRMHSSPDCLEKIFLTTADEPRIFKSDNLYIELTGIPGKDPSFTITSKASIDNIDFLTYVLGALGAWIGFSFISINPVPYIFHVINPDGLIHNRSNEINKKLCREVITNHRNIHILKHEALIARKQRDELLLTNQKFEQMFISIGQNLEKVFEKLNLNIQQSYDITSTPVH